MFRRQRFDVRSRGRIGRRFFETFGVRVDGRVRDGPVDAGVGVQAAVRRSNVVVGVCQVLKLKKQHLPTNCVKIISKAKRIMRKD